LDPSRTAVDRLLAALPDLNRGQLMEIAATWASEDDAATMIALARARDHARSSGREEDLKNSEDAIGHWATTPALPIGSAQDVLVADLRRGAAPALAAAAAALLAGDSLDRHDRDLLLAAWRNHSAGRR
jgi:hypothetical protein